MLRVGHFRNIYGGCGRAGGDADEELGRNTPHSSEAERRVDSEFLIRDRERATSAMSVRAETLGPWNLYSWRS